ncbi:MAG: winged helix DNA-binding protein [Hyphomonadaceae bacterium]|nr:winged helix DNA-binding protein [Hyphomonadaceae bacterium]
MLSAHAARMADLDDLARDIQRHYPRIYIACHVDHRARRGQKTDISARDQTILAHVPGEGIRSRALAAHLKVAPSTVSAALKRLVGMGLIAMASEPGDARARTVRLTQKGRAALSETSVLHLARVKAALARLSAPDRRAVVRGLELLADAAQAASGGE